MMGYDSMPFSVMDNKRYFSCMSYLSNSLTSMAGFWLTSVIAVLKVTASAVVTDRISRIADALCLDLWTLFFPFQVSTPLCHPHTFRQTVTDMTASSANSIIFAYRVWHDWALKFGPNCFRKLTSLMPYCTSGPVLDLHAGVIITQGDAKLNQADLLELLGHPEFRAINSTERCSRAPLSPTNTELHTHTEYIYKYIHTCSHPQGFSHTEYSAVTEWRGGGGGRPGWRSDRASMLPRGSKTTKRPLQIKTLGWFILGCSLPLPPCCIWDSHTLTYIGSCVCCCQVGVTFNVCTWRVHACVCVFRLTVESLRCAYLLWATDEYQGCVCAVKPLFSERFLVYLL